jgi:STE24 endopeptidase
MVIEGIALVLFGWMPYVWDVASMIGVKYSIVSETSSPLWQEIAITCIFVLILIVHDTVISLPFSFYSTFVIEEKHGFNKQVRNNSLCELVTL